MTDVEHINEALQGLAMHLQGVQAMLAELAYSQAAMVQLLDERSPEVFDRYQVLRAESATQSPVAAQLQRLGDSLDAMLPLLQKYRL